MVRNTGAVEENDRQDTVGSDALNKPVLNMVGDVVNFSVRTIVDADGPTMMKKIEKW